VTDTSSGAVYYTRSLEVRWHGAWGAMATASGTTTFTLVQAHEGSMARLAYTDSWRYPFIVHGTTCNVKADVSGLAMILPDGVRNPLLDMRGDGYDSVVFRDIQSNKKVSVTKFSADEVKAGDIPSVA